MQKLNSQTPVTLKKNRPNYYHTKLTDLGLYCMAVHRPGGNPIRAKPLKVGEKISPWGKKPK